MLNAQQTIGVTTDNLKIERNGEYIVVDMNMGLSPLDVESNRAVLLTPRFVCATDTLELPSVGVYGRRRYYYYVRNGESMLSGKKEMTIQSTFQTRRCGVSCYYSLLQMDERFCTGTVS